MACRKVRLNVFFRLRQTAKTFLPSPFTPPGNQKKDGQNKYSPVAKKKAATKKLPPPNNVASPKTRVARHATSLAAAVGQNGYFEPNVAPAQQRNIVTAN